MRNSILVSFPVAILFVSCTSAVFKSGALKVTKANDNDVTTSENPRGDEQLPGGEATPTPNSTEMPGGGATPTPTPTTFPTVNPTGVKTCSKRMSGQIAASDGMYNRNAACGPIGSIDMVTAQTLTLQVPAGAKNLKILSSSISFSRGSCASVVMTYTTHSKGPYHYEGNCQRIAPEFETLVPSGAVLVKDFTPTTHGTYLMMYCKSPRLQSLGMGQNAGGYDVAVMEANAAFDYSYDTPGECMP